MFDVGSVFLPVGRAIVSVGFDFMFGAVSGAERGLGGRGGHKYAAGILSGGSGKRSQGTVNMFSVAGIFGCLMGRT